MATHGLKPLRIIPLGGLGEIGLNTLLLECGGESMLIDAGLMFPKENPLGIDFLIPDFSALETLKSRLCGIFLTHGHEDHIGALPFLLERFAAPVFGAPFTLALLRGRCRAKTVSVDHKPVQCGPFRVTFLPVSHSTLGTRALVIETPAGVVVHSGDYKIDATTPRESRFDRKAFAALAKRKVQVLLADSTNVMRPGHSPREADVAKKYARIFKNAKGRVIVGMFSSHIQRIEQMIALAQAHGRKVFLSGRSLEENVTLARSMGLLKIPKGVEIDASALVRLAPEKVCVLSTGTQGEMRAVLPRMARADHPDLEVIEGDTIVLGTRIIPGNESSIYQMINAFSRQGALVQYGDFADLESSGHAYAGEMLELVRLIKPRFLIPVHGELRHLTAHRRLVSDAGILKSDRIHVAENGEVLELTAKTLKRVDRVKTGRMGVHGGHLESTADAALGERRRLARSGVLCAVLEAKGPAGLDAPRLVSVRCSGLPQCPHPDVLRETLQKFLTQMHQNDASSPRHRAEVEPFVENGIRRFCKKHWGRKPVIMTLWTAKPGASP